MTAGRHCSPRPGTRVPWSPCCLLLLIASGCAVSSAEDDDHLEHHVPPHKPATLAAAVPVLRERCDALAQTTPSDPDQAWSELLDIVRWLPELAGDSDLRRADWERVQEVSRQLDQLLQPHTSSERLPADVVELCRALLDQLEPLLPRAKVVDAAVAASACLVG